jgi:cell division protein WhiA
MATEVKDELSRAVVNSVSARRAEVTSLLRFAGGLHIVGGRVVVEADLDLASIARRLRKNIVELYGYNAAVHVRSASGIRTTTRYVLRVANDGEALARQTGLLDMRGRAVRGLPAHVVGGSIDDAEGVWRGAFLAHEWLSERGASALDVSCPALEAAPALVGAARRLGVSAKVRGGDRVVVRDGEAIGVLLTGWALRTAAWSGSSADCVVRRGRALTLDDKGNDFYADVTAPKASLLTIGSPPS